MPTMTTTVGAHSRFRLKEQWRKIKVNDKGLLTNFREPEAQTEQVEDLPKVKLFRFRDGGEWTPERMKEFYHTYGESGVDYSYTTSEGFRGADERFYFVVDRASNQVVGVAAYMKSLATVFNVLFPEALNQGKKYFLSFLEEMKREAYDKEKIFVKLHAPSNIHRNFSSVLTSRYGSPADPVGVGFDVWAISIRATAVATEQDDAYPEYGEEI